MPCGNYTIKRTEVKRYWARLLIQEPTLFPMNVTRQSSTTSFIGNNVGY